MINMYQILMECITDPALGSAQCLITVADFPAEFPFLIDYMRQSITIELVSKKGCNFVVIFHKLEWSMEQEIIQVIRQLMIDLENRQTREQYRQGG